MESVETLDSRSSNQVSWEEFPKYEKLLWKVTWTWIVKFRGRYEPQELFNELVLAYGDCCKSYSSCIGQPEFGRRLWRSCWNRLIDLVRKEKVSISIDDVIVESTRSEWKEIWSRFFIEDVKALLSTEEGRLMVALVVEQPETLESARLKRRPVSIRNRGMCKEDVAYYLVQVKGWRWKQVWRGFSDVQNAIGVLTQP